MLPEIPTIENATKKLNTIRTRLEKVQRKIREELYAIMNLRRDQVYEPDVNKKLNLLSLMDKIVDINIRFLRSYVDVYELEELALFTTLSRGIFELHLILLEVTCSERNLVRIQFKVNNSYRSFIEKFLGLALKNKDADSAQIYKRELRRVGKLMQELSKRWNVDLRTLRKYSRYFDFEEIAKNHGLLEDYRFDYGILSSFLHPTDLYILTSPPLPGTMEPRKLQLAQWNVRNRRTIVKKECTLVALEYSKKTEKRTLEVIRQFK
jgi:hypothetical protein